VDAILTTTTELINRLPEFAGLPPLAPQQIRGRRVWGSCGPEGRPPLLHVEARRQDRRFLDAAMESIRDPAGELLLGAGLGLFRQRAAALAAEANRIAEDAGLALLVKRNGEPTRALKRLANIRRHQNQLA